MAAKTILLIGTQELDLDTLQYVRHKLSTQCSNLMLTTKWLKHGRTETSDGRDILTIREDAIQALLQQIRDLDVIDTFAIPDCVVASHETTQECPE